MEFSSIKIIKKFLNIAIPASVCSFFNILSETINLIFIGHLNDPVKLAGIGMGNSIINICGVGPIYGINAALETLVSWANGSGNMALCGVYLQRGRIVLLIAYIPMVFIFISSK